jgi:hypothetical protein
MVRAGNEFVENESGRSSVGRDVQYQKKVQSMVRAGNIENKEYECRLFL